MSDEYFNHDGEGSGFFSLILLAVFLLGGFVVARVYEPGQAIGADAAKARLAKREKIETAASDRLAGHAVVSKEKNFVSLPIGTAVTKVAELGSEGTRAALVERSIEKDGKYEAPKPVDVSGVNLADSALIAKGKVLFMTKTCFLCHQTDPAIPAPAGLAVKSPQFIGDFWGKEREVHIGYLGPIQKVVLNEEYFIESVSQPLAKVAKGALVPMTFDPNLVNDEEILALMAYVKSLSK
tara:strand:+ start:327 stop:1040 length:714 start_codon:yes stop_codon:yes gene_type:complete